MLWGEEKSGYRGVCNKGDRWSEHQRLLLIKENQISQVKEFSTFLCLGRCKHLGLLKLLKLQYFGHLMRRTDSSEKTLMLGRIEGGRRRGGQKMRWLDGITDSTDMSSWVNSGCWWWTGRPGVLRFMGSQRVKHIWETELNWTRLTELILSYAPQLFEASILLFHIHPLCS